MKKKINEKEQPLYLVWYVEPNEPEIKYFTQYNSIEDAVSEHGDGCEVYVAYPKRLGKFKRKVEMIKIKARK